MKKVRFLFLALVLVMCAGLIGCGKKVADPTAKDVKKALKAEGYMSDADDDNEDFKVDVVKVKLNDDKDKATVTATTTEKVSPMERIKEYKVTFKLKDDKETWKCREIERLETKEVLAEEISEEAIKQTIEYNIFQIDEDNKFYGRNFEKCDIDKHEIDAEKKTDTVTLNIGGKSGIKEFSADVKVVFEYNYGWFVQSSEVSNGKVEFAKNYALDQSAASIQKVLENEKDNNVYFNSKYIAYSDFTYSNFEVTPVELNGDTWVSVKLTTDVEYKGVTAKAEGSVGFTYDQNNGWTINSTYLNIVYNSYVFPIEGKFTGKYSGSESEPVNYDVTIEIESDDEGNYTSTVTVNTNTEEKGTYSYSGRLSCSSFNDDDEFSFSVRFNEWIDLPADGYRWGYTNFSGYCDGTKFHSTDASFSFEKAE